MMLILSQSQPTVSATVTLRGNYTPHFRVYPLDKVVALLVQPVDRTLGARNLMVVLDSRLVLLVPQLDIRLREASNQGTDRLVHVPMASL